MAQDYDQVLAQIVQFENQKTYTAATTGPMLNSIISGMIDNDSVDLSEGLKRRLVGTCTGAKILKQAAAAENPADGDLLELLFYTRQNPVPVFITDADLKGMVSGNGVANVIAERAFWKNKNINQTNVIRALEGYPPATAIVLVDIVCRTWYRGATQSYQNIDTSWASQSLWQVYYDMREVELAKRSTVVKLLAYEGYVNIPTETDAEFIWSGSPDVVIYLDPVGLSSADIPDLMRLSSSQYYGSMAQEALQSLGQ
jgi:hypothetical protein